MNRRRFLFGAGALVALPFLEGIVERRARATSSVLPFAIFVRQGNGVQQAANGETERFWPSFTPGPFTQEALAGDSDRALSELAEHAKSLTFVRGIRFAYPGNSCKHSSGGNQLLTAAKVSDDDCNSTLALGESIDSRIATQLGGVGDEPLTLYAGRKTGSLDEVLSYRGPRQLRAAERNPFIVYKSLFGLSNVAPDDLEKLQTQRKSVNDLVRDDMQALLSRNDLSKSDRRRLDLHFTAIRDLENGMSCHLAEDETARISSAESSLDDDGTIDSVVKLQCDIMALAVSCGLKRSVTLQIGAGPDPTQYTVDGVRLPSFHDISHRSSAIPDAELLHHRVDRKLLGFFKYLLDKLQEQPTPEGTLLDHGICVYMSDIATGNHSFDDVPIIVAGSAGGALKTGHYVNAGNVTNNKLLNTLGAAVGCINALGQPLDDFGDPSLEKGFVETMLTTAGSASQGGCSI